MRGLALKGFGLVLLLAAQAAAAPSPWLISYQGKLLSSDGIPYDGTVANVVFSIYDAASGGSQLWTETQDLSASSGFFTVQLGAVNPLSPDIFSAPGAGGELYLGIQVPPDAGELDPRQPLAMAPFAASAAGQMNDQGPQVIAGVAYSTFTPDGDLLLFRGLDAETVTASTGSFAVVRSTGVNNFGIMTSSGILLGAGGRLKLSGRMDGSGASMQASTGAFAVVTATGVNSFSIITSSGILMSAGIMHLDGDLQALDQSIRAATGTFAVSVATGVNDFSIDSSSGLLMQDGTFQADGPSIFTNKSSFTASGAAVYSITSSSGIQVNGAGPFLAGAFFGDGSLLGNTNVRLSSSVAVTTTRTWIKPTNVRWVLVEVIGGGGGGGGAGGLAGNSSMGSGGGGGGCALAVVDLQNVASVSVTVSTGAAGAAAGANNGASAAPTSFGAYAAAAGGTGGTGMAAAGTFLVNAGGAGGSGTAGDLLMTGSDGGLAMRLSATQGKSGFGGASACVGGKRANPTGAAAGNAGRPYGGGGSGALTLSNINRAGGAGAAGAVLIRTFN
ncbi:MAG: hypothetical protein HY926_06710 [Elusimicrobia bacterium]|nr:hypothetical protein [Elusimicrobiota bacterium]